MDRLEELEKQRVKVTNEIWKIKAAADQKENAALVGKYFIYRNSYGSGEDWPLYFRICEAKGSRLRTTSFQTDPRGVFTYEPDGSRAAGHFSGCKSITAKQYAAAFRKALAKVKP